VTTLLKHREVAARLGLGVSTLHDMVRRGEFPAPTHLGRAARYSDIEVERWINERLAARQNSKENFNA
jgi:excisionase family DNA binding protein